VTVKGITIMSDNGDKGSSEVTGSLTRVSSQTQGAREENTETKLRKRRDAWVMEWQYTDLVVSVIDRARRDETRRRKHAEKEEEKWATVA
jgi:hypothetical protein